MLKSKRILFIAPDYFNYSMLIRNTIESMGASVDFFYNRPSSKLSKLFFVFNKKFYAKITNKYFDRILKLTDKNYDYVFVIRADIIPERFFKDLKNKNLNAVFIQYIWDDIHLFPKILETFQYFNRILSYELGDCKNYGLFFRPFFFVTQIKASGSNIKRSDDLFFIGSYHTDRLEVLEKVKILNPEIILNSHFYIHPISYILNKLPLSRISLFKFRKMKYPKMIDQIEKSIAILDIQNISQDGLTTRIFEAMGCRSKIVTTNKNIANYEFYNNENILVVDRDNPIIEKSWLEIPYKDYDINQLKRYHIKSWIYDVFYGLNNTEEK